MPGPAVHAREGQAVRVTLTNNAAMPHSGDFRAGREECLAKLKQLAGR